MSQSDYIDVDKCVFGDMHEQELLLKHIAYAGFLVGHNLKFELAWLDRVIDTGKLLIWDTMLAEYVLNGNKNVPLDLDSCLKRRGLKGKQGPVSKMIKAGMCPSEIPTKSLKEYCQQDVWAAEELFYSQREQAIAEGKLGVILTRCILTPVLVELEKTGMHVDKERVLQEYESHSMKLKEVTQKLHEITGGINQNSSKQVSEFLYDKLGFAEPCDYRGQPIRTATGQRTSNAKVLASLKPSTKEQAAFLALHRSSSLLSSAISKNLEFFKGVAEQRGGVFGGVFNQSVTSTHRLSSGGVKVHLEGWDKPRGVQFQNFPRKFKRLFRARNPGWLIGEVDGAQLEFRVAAFLGRDTKAREDIKAGYDIHSFSGKILGVDRQEAKAHTFKPLYGGMSGTKKEKAYYAAFRERYPQLAATQKGWTYTVLEKKSLKLPWGMEFFWPDTTIAPSGFIKNTQDIYNYPVQSLATAEIIPVAVTYLYHRLREAGARSFLVNTVHDSAICEIHPEEVELFKELAVKSFTTDVFEYLYRVYGLVFDVPLGVGIKVGPFWGESPEGEIKKDVENPMLESK